MIDKELYVDPFLSNSDREQYIKKYKKIQKKRSDARLEQSQKIDFVSEIEKVSRSVMDSFKNNKFVVIVRSVNRNEGIDEIFHSLNSKKDFFCELFFSGIIF